MGMHYLNVGMLSSEIFAPSVDQSVVTRDTEDDRRGVLTLPGGDKSIRAMQPIIDAMPKHGSTKGGELVPGNTDLVQELE